MDGTASKNGSANSWLKLAKTKLYGGGKQVRKVIARMPYRFASKIGKHQIKEFTPHKGGSTHVSQQRCKTDPEE
jgi:hypothetical protein